MKKALMNASVASMIYQFNMNNIDILEELGYQVDVACNFGKENPMKETEIAKFKKNLIDRGIKIIETDCPRNPFAFRKLLSTYKQLKNLADTETYDLIHTQSPIGGALCRLAFCKARKKGTRVIYTAHGFHFYKGAPLKNWFIYYPIEKICSYMTDVLITINKEDYERAKRRLHARKTAYIPGVGINVKKIQEGVSEKRLEIRKELGLEKDDILLLSVGELNKNKNHELVIRAISELKDLNIKYIICGQGPLQEHLKKLAKKLGIGDRLFLLGFRSDVIDVYKSADVFIFPSKREGLSVALMEAMACGLPCVVSAIRGNEDLIDKEGGELFDCNSVTSCRDAIKNSLFLDWNKKGEYNKETINNFSSLKIKNKMEKIYLGQKI